MAKEKAVRAFGFRSEALARHVVFGLSFLYIPDTFEEHHAKLVAGQEVYAEANPEDQDEKTTSWFRHPRVGVNSKTAPNYPRSAVCPRANPSIAA